MSPDIQSTQPTDPVSEVLRAWFLPGWRAGLDTEVGVQEIACLGGCESASSFSNAFNRCPGKAPAEFRENGHASREDFRMEDAPGLSNARHTLIA